jgi:hypothetical protein
MKAVALCGARTALAAVDRKGFDLGHVVGDIVDLKEWWF